MINTLREQLIFKNDFQPDSEAPMEKRVELMNQWRKDIFKFCDHVVINTQHGNKYFQPLEFQKEFLEDMNIQPPHYKHTKDRCEGVTTTILVALLYKMIFKHNYSAVYVCNRYVMATEYLRVIKRMYFNLPSWLTENFDVEFGRDYIKVPSLNNTISFMSVDHCVNQMRGNNVNELYLDDIDRSSFCYQQLEHYGFYKFNQVFDFEPSYIPPVEKVEEIKPSYTPKAAAPLIMSFTEKLQSSNMSLVKIEFNRKMKDKNG